jgi:hypothetical protein
MRIGVSEISIGAPPIEIGGSPIPIAARKCSLPAPLKPSAARPCRSAARQFPLPDENAHRSLGFLHWRLAHRHCRPEMPIGDAPISIGDSPMAIGGAPKRISARQREFGRRQSPSARLQSPLPRLQFPLPDENAVRERADGFRRGGNAFLRLSDGHRRRSETHRRPAMDFDETEMRFGMPANSLALAPMDIWKGRMRFSATEISFGEAPSPRSILDTPYM